MLSARTVLVVEKEFLIALDIQRMVEARSAKQTIFARSAAEALSQHRSWGNLGLAIIEVRSGDGDALALCRQLMVDGIPVIVCTADGPMRRGITELPGVPVVLKPLLDRDLASAIETALAVPQNE